MNVVSCLVFASCVSDQTRDRWCTVGCDKPTASRETCVVVLRSGVFRAAAGVSRTSHEFQGKSVMLQLYLIVFLLFIQLMFDLFTGTIMFRFGLLRCNDYNLYLIELDRLS